MRYFKTSYQWQPKVEEPAHICAHPHCNQTGEYRAPIARNLPGKYQYFCLTHIREFNKSWNYFDGMSDNQVEKEMEKIRLGGETWPMGLHNAAARINFNTEKIQDPFDLFTNDDVLKKEASSSLWKDILPEESQAMALLQLEPIFDKKTLRNAYRKMVRRYHPDSIENEGDTDTIKKINHAYDILKKLLNRYEHTSCMRET